MRHTISAFIGAGLSILAACTPVEEREVVSKPTAEPAQPHVSEKHLAEWREGQPNWYEAVEPFQIAGEADQGIYYVGSKGLGMYFIPTKEGHIVIDGGMPDQGGYVAGQIRKLGYDPEDIKILLNTHAHLDHCGGLAELKSISGAQMLVSEGDRSALEGGFYLGSEKESWLNSPPVKPDRIIADGEVVSLGDATLTAHLTPGHSRGCTSWSMEITQGGQSYNALIFCSASVAINRLVGKPQYKGIVDDYRKTFAKTRGWNPDIPLANHPGLFGLMEKRKKQLDGNALAFIDRDEFSKAIARLNAAFERSLAKQTAELAK